MIIIIVIGAFDTIIKGLLQWLEDLEIRELVDTIETRKLRSDLKAWEDAQNSMGFWDKNASSNLGQTTRPSDNQQKEKKR